MKMLVAVLLIACGAIAHAQSATVAELTPDEAAQARSLWNAKEAAQAAWDKFEGSITTKYTRYKSKTKVGYLKPGWGSGAIEFTPDFRFIVPGKATTISACPVSPWYYATPTDNGIWGGFYGDHSDQGTWQFTQN